MRPSSKIFVFFPCLPLVLLYFLVQGCTEPQGPPQPYHYTRVPPVTKLQGSIGTSPGGKRRILLTWEYETTNTNIRSWDVYRNINDTTSAGYIPLEIVRLPGVGFPSYSDSTTTIQTFADDSLNIYYKVIPSGEDNFIGPTSDVLHVILRKN